MTEVAFLLDTNVVSELRRRKPNPHVLAWQRAQRKSDVFVSVLVIGEIRRGIERIRPRDEAQAEVLDRWLAGLVTAYRERILPVTADVAQEWGRLNALPQAPPIVDGIMAATAKVHGLTFVTRNARDVARTGVPVVDPFQPRRSA